MAAKLRVRAGAVTVLLLFAVMTRAEQSYQLQTIAIGLVHPWSVAMLPEGDFLVTERGGNLLRIDANGTASHITNTPETYVAGQGGYFDILLDPQFTQNRRVFLSFARGSPESNGPAVVRGILDKNTLRDVELIYSTHSPRATPQHYGGRMLFLEDGTLLLTAGDGFDYREQAQNLDSELGKVLRINPDGSVPRDNPFAGPESSRIWTYGHRNPQGLALDRESSRVYMHEHGPRGGDELNLLQPGINYGWPAITYGVDYSGAHISPFTTLPGMAQPLHYWTPSIAPSGMALYDGDKFPLWRGDLFVGALVNKEVRRLNIEKGSVVDEEPLFTEVKARIRDVYSAPDGHLYLLTDEENGRLLRVIPGSRPPAL